jgi:hypothetical protein
MVSHVVAGFPGGLGDKVKGKELKKSRLGKEEKFRAKKNRQ